MLALELCKKVLTFGIMAQEQNGSFREGPFEMDVADLAAGGADPLACGFFGALDQARIGGKVLTRGKRPMS